MNAAPPVQPVHLLSQWYIREGCEAQVLMAVSALVAKVQAHEPDTLVYLVHTPLDEEPRLKSRPPTDPRTLLFFEIYRSPQAFLDHLHGPLFGEFVREHGACFLNADGSPNTTLSFLRQRAGFIRQAQIATADSGSGSCSTLPVNQHPAVMFELIAHDQASLKAFYSQVFGWTYQTGTGGFAYVQFPLSIQPLLGGIGQANPSIPGFEPGHSFYLLVDNLEIAISRALAAGGKAEMAPTQVDGYRFAMVRDPEGNPLGLIEAF